MIETIAVLAIFGILVAIGIPACTSGTIAPATNAKGFYVCLDRPTNARKVELHFRAKLNSESSEIYQVSSQAFSRSQ